MINMLRIMIWNSNGLAQHKDELAIYLKKEKIDIALISEARFTDKTYFNIHGYRFYVTLHPSGRAHGGSAVLIKNSIPHYECCPSYCTHKLQATTIKLETLPFNITLSAIYVPPRFTPKPEEFQHFFSTLGPRFIAGGDWNSKHTYWGSRLINPRGRNLYAATRTGSFTFMSTGEPTYWPTDHNRIPDLLDFYIGHGISDNYTHVEPDYDLSSDHSVVTLTLSTTVILKPTSVSLTSTKTNWDEFRRYIEENINLKTKLKTPQDIDDVVEYTTKLIQEAAQYATPPPPDNISRTTNIPKHISDLIAEKRRVRQHWQNTRNPADKTRLNRLTRQLRQLLKKRNNELFEDYLINLNTHDGSLWKPTKKLKRPIQRVPPLRKSDQNWAKTDQEKAQLFADHLSEVFKPFPVTPDTDLEEQDIIKSFLDVPCQLSLPVKPITPADIRYTIKMTKVRKAPGFDLITGKILQELPDKAITLLTHIYNAMLRISYWATVWKYSEIVMIQKPGKPPVEVSSYRPISLLPALAKIFEKLLLRRILSEEAIQNAIPNHQFGFRSSHSTIQQVHRIVNTAAAALEEKSFCSAAFLDAVSAFDKVWHTGLLYKIKTTLPQQIYLLLKSYLKDRFFRVKFNGCLSNYGQIMASVPQGGVLAPFLYLLYTHDMPVTPETVSATYADDIAILAKDRSKTIASDKLQNHLILIEKWLKKWRIKINETKSVHVTFTMKKSTCPPVALNNVLLPQASSVKYLGMHLDQKLTWRQHLEMKKKQLNIKYRKMFWLIGPHSKLSIQNKILLYKMVLKPVWTYGIELWGCAKPSNIKLIQTFQNKTLRKMIGAPYYVSNRTIHEDLKIPYVTEEITRRPGNYQNRIPNHYNPLIRDLENPICNVKRLKRTYPTDLFQI